MKGIAHFSTGLAIASCFPKAVEAAVAGNPWYLLLGGVVALLPDTLDFKVGRLLYRHDIEVAPDPNRDDPEMIAHAVAAAVERALTTGRPVRLRLDTVPIGAGRWRPYEVHLDVADRAVTVTYGAAIGMGGEPVEAPRKKPPSASVRLCCPVTLGYEATIRVDWLEGPVLEVAPEEGIRVRINFIPWHRRWSHSPAFGLVAGALVWLAFDVWAGAVTFLAHASHVLLDQVGHMGSALLYPFRKRRVEGMHAVSSSDAFWNFATVWLGVLLIFWNLYAAIPVACRVVNPVQLLLLGGVAPLIAFRWLLGSNPESATKEEENHGSPAFADGIGEREILSKRREADG